MAVWKQERDTPLPSSPTCFAKPWHLSVPKRQRPVKSVRSSRCKLLHRVSNVDSLPYAHDPFLISSSIPFKPGKAGWEVGKNSSPASLERKMFWKSYSCLAWSEYTCIWVLTSEMSLWLLLFGLSGLRCLQQFWSRQIK